MASIIDRSTALIAILGGADYIRDRPAEFASKNVPRTTLLEQLDHTILVVDPALRKVSNEQLQNPYPQDVDMGDMTSEYFWYTRPST